MEKSVHTVRPTNAPKQKVFITCYSVPSCFDRRRDNHHGNLQDYKESKKL